MLLIFTKGYYFVPRVIIFGHLLSFSLIISGILGTESRLKKFFNKAGQQENKPFSFAMILGLTIVSILYSTSFKEMINYGMLGKKMTISDELREKSKESIRKIEFNKKCRT